MVTEKFRSSCCKPVTDDSPKFVKILLLDLIYNSSNRQYCLEKYNW